MTANVMSYCSTGLLLIFPNADQELVTYMIEEKDHSKLFLTDPGGKIDPIDNDDPLKTTEREYYEETCMLITLNHPLACIDLSDHRRVIHKLYLAYHPTALISPEEFQTLMTIRREIFRFTQTLNHINQKDYLKSRHLRIVKLTDLLGSTIELSSRMKCMLKIPQLRVSLEYLITKYAESPPPPPPPPPPPRVPLLPSPSKISKVFETKPLIKIKSKKNQLNTKKFDKVPTVIPT